MLLNRISGRLAVGAGAAAVVAGAAFVAAYADSDADAGQAVSALRPTSDAPEDFFAATEQISGSDLRRQREQAQRQIDAASGAAVTTGTGSATEVKEEPEEKDEGDAGGSDGAIDPDIGGDVDNLNWSALAQCESGGDPTKVSPAGFYGLYQFSMSTWQSAGGTGSPADASADEQTMRAKKLYTKVDGNWQGQWPECGRHLFD
ncbi:transglycosylase family protein [Nocardiopsis gilva]|uniref:transglycosylase family protein n=1 Tax=Nocardiopsis gilva TaxID=280236 RepID=UPI000477E7E6|nr:transglycosylase family protein [Nocardiopsis gilva]